MDEPPRIDDEDYDFDIVIDFDDDDADFNGLLLNNGMTVMPDTETEELDWLEAFAPVASDREPATAPPIPPPSETNASEGFVKRMLQEATAEAEKKRAREQRIVVDDTPYDSDLNPFTTPSTEIPPAYRQPGSTASVDIYPEVTDRDRLVVKRWSTGAAQAPTFMKKLDRNEVDSARTKTVDKGRPLKFSDCNCHLTRGFLEPLYAALCRARVFGPVMESLPKTGVPSAVRLALEARDDKTADRSASNTCWKTLERENLAPIFGRMYQAHYWIALLAAKRVMGQALRALCCWKIRQQGICSQPHCIRRLEGQLTYYRVSSVVQVGEHSGTVIDFRRHLQTWISAEFPDMVMPGVCQAIWQDCTGTLMRCMARRESLRQVAEPPRIMWVEVIASLPSIKDVQLDEEIKLSVPGLGSIKYSPAALIYFGGMHYVCHCRFRGGWFYLDGDSWGKSSIELPSVPNFDSTRRRLSFVVLVRV